MKTAFEHIAIIGLGLIGGSLAHAVRRKKLVRKITGYGRNPARLQKACALGLVDDYSVEFDKGLKGADLVVIGTPVRVIAQQARQIIPQLLPGTVITDVGSVKGHVVHEIEPLVGSDVFFVGGHPIAGTENSGFEAAMPDLFEERICVLTPTDHTNSQAYERLQRFWQQVGSRVVSMDVQTHDMIFAAISHLPHMVAFSLVNAIVALEDFEKNNILQYSAGGFKDFTRIAASDPVMWRDIALMNRDNILRSLDFFQQALDVLREAVRREDAERIEDFFCKSRDARSGI